MNKNRRIEFRISDEDLEFITKKSKSYKNLSSFIIDACKNMDDKAGIKKIEFLDSWAQNYINCKNDLLHLANNLNQLVKLLHVSKFANENYLNVVNDTCSRLNELISDLYKQNQTVLDEFKQIYK